MLCMQGSVNLSQELKERRQFPSFPGPPLPCLSQVLYPDEGYSKVVFILQDMMANKMSIGSFLHMSRLSQISKCTLAGSCG